MDAFAEQRRVRFCCIDGIERDDLPLAGEIWRDDVIAAPWADRAAMKIATHLALYMGYPSPELLKIPTIEEQYRLSRDDLEQGLGILRNYGAIQSFSLDGDRVRAALSLTLMQRLRVLEAKSRFVKLLGRCPEARNVGATWLDSRSAIGHARPT